ncbi:MAG: hypothetical protein JXX29_21625 [Deltaproteobacteria bacterium]|nr:hypothetical protein [Deltaproteobacteria bacterium]MBN2674296.1 hypothetical protein [Deltaproteobacteria bacterium]
MKKIGTIMKIDVGMVTMILAMVLIIILAGLEISCSKVDNDAEADAQSESPTNSDNDPSSLDSDNSNSELNEGDTGAEEIEFQECAAVSEQAENTREPADIIFVIDNSKSLYDEIEMVRANMNDFSQQIMSSGIDPRIVIISCLPGDCGSTGSVSYGICIDPPLGAADGCEYTNDEPDTDDPEEPVTDDTNIPVYKHISIRVPSMKGLEWLISTYDDNNVLTVEGWHDMIRTNSVKHVVVVSDDGDETTADEFDAAFTALSPDLVDYQFHGIFAYTAKDLAEADDPCSTYAAPSSPDADPPIYWDSYTALVERTSGVSGDLCEQNFDPVFEALGSSVIASSKLNCEWALPTPPDGETLDPDLVNVRFSSATVDAYLVGNVPSAADCPPDTHGWYYDDATAPSRIYVCPDTCTWFQNQTDATLSIEFGCVTQTVMAE